MLAVVGLVIGGIWWAASAVTETQRVNKMVEAILIAHTRTSKVFARNLPSGAVPALDGNLSASLRLVPPDLATSDAYYSGIDPWGRFYLIQILKDWTVMPGFAPDVVIINASLSARSCPHVIAKVIAGFNNRSSLDRVSNDLGAVVFGGTKNIPSNMCADDINTVHFQFILARD